MGVRIRYARVFALSGRLTLVALIRAPGVVTRILTHMGLSAEVPWIRPARPANPLLTFDVQGGFSYNQEDLRGLSEK